MSILTKIFMLELRIFKLHRKTIFQETPSSDTPILLGMAVALENGNTNQPEVASRSVKC